MSHGVLCMALFFIIVNAARKHSTIEIEITFEHKLKRTASAHDLLSCELVGALVVDIRTTILSVVPSLVA